MGKRLNGWAEHRTVFCARQRAWIWYSGDVLFKLDTERLGLLFFFFNSSVLCRGKEAKNRILCLQEAEDDRLS